MSRRPPLDKTILSDPEALGAAIDKVLLKSADLHRLSKKIRRRQRALRRLVDDDGWRMYLRVEEAVNERAVAEAELLVLWAFNAGIRSGRP